MFLIRGPQSTVLPKQVLRRTHSFVHLARGFMVSCKLIVNGSQFRGWAVLRGESSASHGCRRKVAHTFIGKGCLGKINPIPSSFGDDHLPRHFNRAVLGLIACAAIFPDAATASQTNIFALDYPWIHYNWNDGSGIEMHLTVVRRNLARMSQCNRPMGRN